MSKVKLIYDVFTSPKRLRTILAFNSKGYLDEVGWFNAFDSQAPVDQDHNPIPWVTYSFIDFIKDRLRKKHSVFEFGSGNSTYFYAKYAGSVVSVEHDKAWYDANCFKSQGCAIGNAACEQNCPGSMCNQVSN